MEPGRFAFVASPGYTEDSLDAQSLTTYTRGISFYSSFTAGGVHADSY